MSNEPRVRELQFHADRVQESATRVIKSVIHDPRITPEEQIELLADMSKIHIDIAKSIQTAIEVGYGKAFQYIDDLHSA